VIWFDAHESVGLTPGAVLHLFTLIHEHHGEKRGGPLVAPHCPYCHAELREIGDVQRNVRFTYWGCTKRHGRLSRFVEFLREKHFVRPLDTQELAELRKKIRVVHCNACGAPVEVAERSSCNYCGAALSILDPVQVQKIVNDLRAAEHKRVTVDPELPQKLMLERLELERQYRDQTVQGDAFGDGPPALDLIQEGLAAVAALLRR
jgi:hypothetical protein